jgi:hypothetical protein
MAASRIAWNPSFRWVTSILIIRGAEGAWGEGVRDRRQECCFERRSGFGRAMQWTFRHWSEVRGIMTWLSRHGNKRQIATTAAFDKFLVASS